MIGQKYEVLVECVSLALVRLAAGEHVEVVGRVRGRGAGRWVLGLCEFGQMKH